LIPQVPFPDTVVFDTTPVDDDPNKIPTPP
jgi:hypothetical protein